MVAQVSMGRVGRMNEVADAVAFLASRATDYITGDVLRIDGGLSASL